MQCQECHERPATLHFTKVVNGNKTEMHVCQHCAKEIGYVSYDDEPYSLHDLLSGLFNFESTSVGDKKKHTLSKSEELKCPKCGMTYQEFTGVGKFGCSHCYQTFADRLNPLFRRVHSGNINHEGKIPRRIGGNLKQKKQLNELKQQLQYLIEKEEFEEAANVRDQIKALDKTLDHKQAEEDEG
ncbi:UvrB/UvrC motif-containing protein [Radiobacillus sp. PE A8.2]|uniref:UvrB/UvrC motif-containing protein n=1 Tax=Radiobacillus sp. PE A8.2 TaxID=3380349 RepID=UPI00388FACB1